MGLLSEPIRASASGDLLIVIEGNSDNANQEALIAIDTLLAPTAAGPAQYIRCATLAAGQRQQPQSNLALISVNGIYAVREARQALQLGLHVMLFSDNISLEDEIALKRQAHEQGLLLMGPDCGTAIINGVVLGFGNNVRRGSIGIVGASGTGSQEVSTRIHQFGHGISQLIGTGGRDLSEPVGGLMMLDALNMLAEDPDTRVIVLVSKPPAAAVAERVLTRARAVEKPVVIWFAGPDNPRSDEPGLLFAGNSKQAALNAVLAAGAQAEQLALHPLNWPLIGDIRAQLAGPQRYIRGLFCGGTLCDEAMFLAMEKYPDVYSNIHPDPAFRLADLSQSQGHTFLDFGDDAFTNGKPHPMIDPGLRIQRLLHEARDPQVGVILMDFILGYGAHQDPVGVMLPAIQQAQATAAAENRPLVIVGYVLGTDQDSQSLQRQCQMLTDAGVIWASSSTNAGLLAREFVCQQKELH
ncbi:FdrA family protein [Shimwellia pseudoproteus]|uniref:FdrA family protein n=1 Tax=Shimwellia pseudoproteus TaxID=570012 RepID=UPI0018EC9C25|nr:FdrA family protein [Shimwellia pseudoproteus]MBJ3817085.1 FdrA family protein [Shimwellia pseudoproteus]